MIGSTRRYRGAVARFAAIATARPDLPAVVGAGERWTYGQLAARAEELRRLLDASGVGHGDVVAVIADRCAARTAAWLAVLAHHAVLMPVDPATTPERRRRMFDVADARWTLVVDPINIEETPRLIRVSAAVPHSTPRLHIADAPSRTEAGYVMFTSGSTGPPKAIVGRSRSLEHFLLWQQGAFGIGVGDRVAQLASPEFDPVLREVLGPLVSGATSCLPPPGLLAPVDVLAWLADERISVANMVPSLARAWIVAAPADIRVPSLRLTCFTGEPLSGELVRSWRGRCGGEVVNLYGPTETTSARCWHRVAHPPLQGVQPLGRPIDNTTISVERPDGRQAAVGEVGEIVIRTPFATNGYRGASAQDAARYRRPLFAPWHTIYRTGDLGHLDHDRVLHYDGRSDDQIKIYGVRLHLAGIEAALECHPAVQHAAVVPDTAHDPPRRLLAYLVLADDHASIPADLRAVLRRTLPLTAIPAVFTAVPELPRTRGGKLDRRSLTDSAARTTESADSRGAP